MKACSTRDHDSKMQQHTAQRQAARAPRAATCCPRAPSGERGKRRWIKRLLKVEQGSFQVLGSTWIGLLPRKQTRIARQKFSTSPMDPMAIYLASSIIKPWRKSCHCHHFQNGRIPSWMMIETQTHQKK